MTHSRTTLLGLHSGDVRIPGIPVFLRAKKWKLKVEFFDKINSVLDRNE